MAKGTPELLETAKNESSVFDLSIIIPLYNVEPYIKECLDSVTNQTLDKSRYEVIVVDDCSSDQSLKIVEEFKGKLNLKVVHFEKNQGVKKARIEGYKIAKGKYIGWIDADDFIEPEMYEVMLEKAEEEDLDLVICDYLFEATGPVKRKKWFHEWNGTMDWEFLDNNTQHWNKVMKREVMDRHDFCTLEDQIGEGALALIIPFTEKAGTIFKELYHYRMTPGSASSNKSNLGHFEGDVTVSVLKTNLAKEKGMSDEWIAYFDNCTTYRALLAMLISAKVGNKEAYKKYRKMICSGGDSSKRRTGSSFPRSSPSFRFSSFRSSLWRIIRLHESAAKWLSKTLKISPYRNFDSQDTARFAEHAHLSPRGMFFVFREHENELVEDFLFGEHWK